MVLTTIDPSKFVVQSDSVLGAVEVSTFIGLVLYGISVSQGYSYFRTRKDDRLSLKLLVVAILFLETCHSFTACMAIYYDTVTRFRDPEANSYPISTNVLFETLITFVVQMYFSYRIYRLSAENLLIGLGCLTFVVLRCTSGFVLAIECYLDVPNNPNGISLVVHFSWLITSGLAAGGAADVLIAFFMIYYLLKLASPFNTDSTTNFINRLIRWTLQTGLITSLTSVSTIICFQAMKNMVWFGLYIILAKIYSNSLLVSLNARPFKTAQRHHTGKTLTTLQFAVGPGPISLNFPANYDADDLDSQEKSRSMEKELESA
ncbi:hypothetical protein BDN70DRAFT_921917 [Pholiota conissans]|uniref:DUF6534 domain-containing protein n=1 Tax=Pholiota conissans TaxID=109636 RepID=A0A9P6CTI6_9AGAR|nr:hypothetical protein BDN70DRAFT_921917 [Pholiota conissans]